VELRSADSEALHAGASAVQKICQAAIVHDGRAKVNHHGNARGNTERIAQVNIEQIGDRPAAALSEGSVLMQTVRAVDRHLNLATDERLGSTDANIPLSLGIPAIAIGTGGTGGNIHTLQEWYDPAEREIALRRVLLTLLGITQITAEREATVHSSA
jgi:di/tripeptidase